jgi:transcriptional regulator with PAS, ATPase and Fis domain
VPSDPTERTSTDGSARRARVTTYLFLALEGSRLDAGGLRIALSGVDELTIGRGDARVLGKNARARTLTIPDFAMSTTHVRVVRKDGALHVSDAGSTNGTLVNGKPVTEARLRDGDVVELGQTVFLYRDIVDEDGTGRETDLDSAAPARGKGADLPGLVTLDPILAHRLERLARVGASPLATILLGETGTGKEVLARSIHALSKRPGPFVAVNCGAIPQNLVESQLFGHVRGAFSGALRDEPGLVRSAHFGTLLLDEVGDLPLTSQAALLRVIQEGEVRPVGAVQPVKVDVRVVSATHRPLESLVEKGEFRRDLFARLAGYTFTLAPLRDRMVDLGLLIAALYTRDLAAGARPLRLHHESVRAMLRYDWPMNVRELEQCLRALAVLADDDYVKVADLPPAIAQALDDAPHDDEDTDGKDDEIRRELLVKMAETRGNLSEVARLMGKARQQVQRWVRRYAIDPEAFREK